MPSLQDIRRRIRSVKNTQQVTKAMKMISAVKLRKAQERLMAMRPYSSKLRETVAAVIARFEPSAPLPDSPLALAFLKPREEQRIRVVVVASDKGLCGGFNANLIKAADQFMAQRGAQVAHLDVIGKRASDWARKAGLKPVREFTMLPATAFVGVAADLAREAVEQYEQGLIDALYVLYSNFNSAVSQSPNCLKVFPVQVEPEPSAISHLLEPDAGTVLASLLPRYLEIELTRTLFESATGEHAARMAAMDKASSNAAEMIDKLTLNMNKVRQAAITNQIIEVVSGAAS